MPEFLISEGLDWLERIKERIDEQLERIEQLEGSIDFWESDWMDAKRTVLMLRARLLSAHRWGGR